jgi:hypothetical protein
MKHVTDTGRNANLTYVTIPEYSLPAYWHSIKQRIYVGTRDGCDGGCEAGAVACIEAPSDLYIEWEMKETLKYVRVRWLGARPSDEWTWETVIST